MPGAGGADCAQVTARLKDGSLAPEDCRRPQPGEALRPLPGGPRLGSPAGGAVSGAAPAGAAGSVRDQRTRTRLAAPGHQQQQIHPDGGHRTPGLTISPFYLLVVDTGGDTVDMSMVYPPLAPQLLDQGLSTHRLAESSGAATGAPRGGRSPERGTGRLHRLGYPVGPICVAELPLFLGEAAWQPPPGSEQNPGISCDRWLPLSPRGLRSKPKDACREAVDEDDPGGG